MIDIVTRTILLHEDDDDDDDDDNITGPHFCHTYFHVSNEANKIYVQTPACLFSLYMWTPGK